jgi:hypothetical protein
MAHSVHLNLEEWLITKPQIHQFHQNKNKETVRITNHMAVAQEIVIN